MELGLEIGSHKSEGPCALELWLDQGEKEMYETKYHCGPRLATQ